MPTKFLHFSHEIVGVVTEVGSKVKKVKAGDKVGVGYMVGSCRSCDQCSDDQEQYCSQITQTYNAHDVVTYGGYSDHMVANEHFIILWPEDLPLDVGAPLLCAGITVYSPMRYYGLDKAGMHVGVVSVISTNPNKKEEAISELGADSFLVSHDQPQMEAAMGTLDGIIDTVSANHALRPLINLLKPNGKLILVGAPAKPHELHTLPLLSGRKLVGGSQIGGIKETQDMIDFAAKNKITTTIELIPIDYINTAMERLKKSDVRYRFVIDVANTLKST
ncbi:hypothetical protein SSX86_014890 [Deinandra increscens subsp. villosa]|uniref:Uncharacterized protein n=1 Tax=Deinandra increscens subsp. villosa TaxID=3103831 RepID=A0AAP0GYG0_9ASTR